MDKVSLRKAVTLALRELGVQVLKDPTRFLSMLHDCCAENDTYLAILDRNCDDELLRPLIAAAKGKASFDDAAYLIESLLYGKRCIDRDVAYELSNELVGGLADCFDVDWQPLDLEEGKDNDEIDEGEDGTGSSKIQFRWWWPIPIGMMLLTLSVSVGLTMLNECSSSHIKGVPQDAQVLVNDTEESIETNATDKTEGTVEAVRVDKFFDKKYGLVEVLSVRNNTKTTQDVSASFVFLDREGNKVATGLSAYGSLAPGENALLFNSCAYDNARDVTYELVVDEPVKSISLQSCLSIEETSCNKRRLVARVTNHSAYNVRLDALWAYGVKGSNEHLLLCGTPEGTVTLKPNDTKTYTFKSKLWQGLERELSPNGSVITEP